jgi:hypothetical protein
MPRQLLLKLDASADARRAEIAALRFTLPCQRDAASFTVADAAIDADAAITPMMPDTITPCRAAILFAFIRVSAAAGRRQIFCHVISSACRHIIAADTPICAFVYAASHSQMSFLPFADDIYAIRRYAIS